MPLSGHLNFQEEGAAARLFVPDGYTLNQNKEAGSVIIYPNGTKIKRNQKPLVTFGRQWEEKVSEKTIQISITARSYSETAEPFGIKYHTQEVGTSGTKRFNAGKDFKIFAFEYSVPKLVEGKNDILLIESDFDKDNLGIEIKSISVTVVE